MKNKELLITQLKHIEEYVEIIDKIDPIEYWNWDYDPRIGTGALILAGKNEIHTITFTNIRAKHQIGGTKK